MDDFKDVLVPGRMMARNAGLYDTASEKKTEATEKAGAAAASQAALDKKEDAADLLRKKRNTMFQTEGGSSGVVSESVGARDTYFGN